jgi:alcohol dehydrogenase class IV
MKVSDSSADQAAIDFVADFLARLGLASRLREHGVTPAHLDRLVEQAFDDPCHKTNAVPVTREDLRKLYSEVL